MSHARLYPQLQSITAISLVLISCTTDGRRLSWPGWLGEILRWFAHPSINQAPHSNLVEALTDITATPNRHAPHVCGNQSQFAESVKKFPKREPSEMLEQDSIIGRMSLLSTGLASFCHHWFKSCCKPSGQKQVPAQF